MTQKIDLGNVKGKDGVGIASIKKVKSNANTQTDTYRITFTNDETFDYTIKNNKYIQLTDELVDSSAYVPTSRAVLYGLEDVLDNTYPKNEADITFSPIGHTHEKSEISDFSKAVVGNYTDLNDIKEPGFYYGFKNTDTTSIANKPLQTISFYLLVERGSSDNYVKQTWTHYSQNYEVVYVRTCNAGVWGKWQMQQSANLGHEYVVSTHDSSSNKWTGTCRWITELKVGTTIFYYLQQSPVNSDTTLKLTLPTNNGGSSNTDEIEILFKDGTNIRNKYPVNSVIGMVYDGTVWRVINPVQSNSSAHTHATTEVEESSSFTSIGSDAGDSQHTINSKINSKLASIVFSAVNSGNMIVDSTLTQSSDFPVSSSAIYDEIHGGHTHNYSDLVLTENTSGNNIDFNDYTIKGHYYIWGAEQPNNTNKPPNDTRGGLLVVEDIPNGKLQMLYNYYNEKPKIFYRIYHNTAGWRDWQTLSVVGEPSIRILPSGDEENPTDLDTYMTTGFYYCGSQSDASTFVCGAKTLPEVGKAFTLIVEERGSANYLKQTLTHWASNKTYVRIKNSGEWGDWKLSISEDNASNTKPLVNHYNLTGGIAGESINYARADHQHTALFGNTTGGVSTACYVNILEISTTASYQDKPITFTLHQRKKRTPTYVSIRLSSTDVGNGEYTVEQFHTWGDDTQLYLKQIESNKWSLIAYKTSSNTYSVADLWGGNANVVIETKDTQYGLTAPTNTLNAPMYTNTYIAGATPFGTTAKTVCEGNDDRLSDARQPSITNLTTNDNIDEVLDTGHYVLNDNVSIGGTMPSGTGLSNKAFVLLVDGDNRTVRQTLTFYKAINRTFTRMYSGWNANLGWSEWKELSVVGHTHTQEDVVDFEHTHAKSEITDFAHTHTKSEINDFEHSHPTINLTSSDNVDELLTTGHYVLNENVSIEGTMPSDSGLSNKAFILMVDGDNYTTRQTLTFYKNIARTFTRVYSGYQTNEGWSEWIELSNKWVADVTYSTINDTAKTGYQYALYVNHGIKLCQLRFRIYIKQADANIFYGDDSSEWTGLKGIIPSIYRPTFQAQGAMNYNGSVIVSTSGNIMARFAESWDTTTYANSNPNKNKGKEIIATVWWRYGL